MELKDSYQTIIRRLAEDLEDGIKPTVDGRDARIILAHNHDNPWDARSFEDDLDSGDAERVFRAIKEYALYSSAWKDVTEKRLEIRSRAALADLRPGSLTRLLDSPDQIAAELGCEKRETWRDLDRLAAALGWR